MTKTDIKLKKIKEITNIELKKIKQNKLIQNKQLRLPLKPFSSFQLLSQDELPCRSFLHNPELFHTLGTYIRNQTLFQNLILCIYWCKCKIHDSSPSQAVQPFELILFFYGRSLYVSLFLVYIAKNKHTILCHHPFFFQNLLNQDHAVCKEYALFH